MTLTGKYFYGNEISKYGQENGRLDYATLSKAFDSVLNNEIINSDTGCWDMVSGWIDNSEEIDGLRDKLGELEDRKQELEEKVEALKEIEMDEEADLTEEIEAIESDILDVERNIEEIEEEIDELESEVEPEVFQWYIVSDSGARILEEINEIIYYNESIDMYVWGVTHWGTAWDYVLTDVPCNTEAQ